MHFFPISDRMTGNPETARPRPGWTRPNGAAFTNPSWRIVGIPEKLQTIRPSRRLATDSL